MKIFEDSVNRKSKMSCNTGCLATVARCYCNIEDRMPRRLISKGWIDSGNCKGGINWS